MLNAHAQTLVTAKACVLFLGGLQSPPNLLVKRKKKKKEREICCA